MNQNWINLGAVACAGSKGNNNMPEPWMHYFWNNWKSGMTFKQSVLKSYEDTKNIWLIAYKVLDAVGIEVLPGKSPENLIEDSIPVFAGNCTLSMKDIGFHEST